MADHDLMAELAGYRRELESLERLGKRDRAEQVRPKLAAVEAQVRAKGAALVRAAVAAREAGQDAIAERLTVQAQQWQTAAGPEPVMEQAVPARARRARGEGEG